MSAYQGGKLEPSASKWPLPKPADLQINSAGHQWEDGYERCEPRFYWKFHEKFFTLDELNPTSAMPPRRHKLCDEQCAILATYAAQKKLAKTYLSKWYTADFDSNSELRAPTARESWSWHDEVTLVEHTIACRNFTYMGRPMHAWCTNSWKTWPRTRPGESGIHQWRLIASLWDSRPSTCQMIELSRNEPR